MGNKKVKEFTTEELRNIRLNPYVKSATTKQIRFTVAFKEEFWRRYTEEHQMPIQIVTELGFDPQVLGESRINGILMHIRQAAESGEEFHDVRRSPVKKDEQIDQSPTVSVAMRKMQHEIDYMKQELEFIKKTILLDRKARQKK